MDKQVYAVYDKVAADIVGGLFVFTHDAPAVRIFVDGLNDASTSLNKHPADYALLCLGDIVPAHDGQAIPSLDGYNKARVVLDGAAWAATKDEA